VGVEKIQELTGYPSIDKPWLKYYTQEELAVSLPRMTLYQNIWRNNKDYPNDPAILYFGKRISYGELFRQIDECAVALRKNGVKKGDCVTLCTAGTPEAIMIVLACNKLGALANFLNPLFTMEQMIDRINDTEAKLLFVLDKVYGRIADVLEKTCIRQVIVMPVYHSMPQPKKLLVSLQKKDPRMARALKQGKNHQSWQAFLRKGQGAAPQEYASLESPYKPDTPAVMVYSSGTTGASKGIVLTNDGILSTAYNKNIPPDPIKRNDTFLQMIPIWFSTGIVISIFIPLIYGSIVISEPVFSKESFVRDLKCYRPNMTLTATSLWLYAVNAKELEGINFSQMNCPITGGEKVLEKDEFKINAFLNSHGCKTKLYKGYGMCELGGTVTSTSDAVGYSDQYLSSGYPIRGVCVSAFNITTNQEMQYGMRGEIRVSSPSSMKYYYKNDQATNEFFYTDEHGVKWGRTGDIGYVDEDGNVFILGRASDSFTADNGELVYNFDAEGVILQDDRVTACKALGVNVNGKTIPVAHIQLRDGVQDTFANVVRDIDAQCRKALPPCAVPMAYKQRDSFPVHPNGKRDVQSLKQERNDFVDSNGNQIKL